MVAVGGAVAAVAFAASMVGGHLVDGARSVRSEQAAGFGHPAPHSQATGGWFDDRAFAAFVDEQIRQARGEIDNRLLAAKAIGGPAAWRAAPTATHLVWGGHRRDGRQVIVATKRQPSGTARIWVFEASRLRPRLEDPVAAASQPRIAADELLAAVVREDHSVHGGTVRFDDYVIVGPADGTRYEVLADGHTLHGQLDDGGAVVELGSAERAVSGAKVTVFDRRGRVVATGVTRDPTHRP